MTRSMTELGNMPKGRVRQTGRIKAAIMNLEKEVQFYVRHSNNRNKTRQKCLLQITGLLKRLLEASLED